MCITRGSESDYWGTDNFYYAYTITWMITEPESGLSTKIQLGFKSKYLVYKTKKSLFNQKEILLGDYEELIKTRGTLGNFASIGVDERCVFYKYEPTTTAPQVEAQIKAWLVQIFSEQK